MELAIETARVVPRWIGLPGQDAAATTTSELVLIAMVAVAIDQATKAAALRMLPYLSLGAFAAILVCLSQLKGERA